MNGLKKVDGKSVLLWGGVLLLAVISAGLLFRAGGHKPVELVAHVRDLANVSVETIIGAKHCEILHLPGRLEADRLSSITSELSGRLERWLVVEGAKVRKGEVLAEINDDILRTQQVQAKATVVTATANLAYAKEQVEQAKVMYEKSVLDLATLQLELRAAESAKKVANDELVRVKKMHDKMVVADSVLEQAQDGFVQRDVILKKVHNSIELGKVGVKSAKLGIKQSEVAVQLASARLLETKAALQLIVVNLAKCKIRAPFAGHFEEHIVDVGEVVIPGMSLGKVYDLSYIRAVVDVPDRYAPLLVTDNPAIQEYISYTFPGAKQDVYASIRLPGLPKLTGGVYTGPKLKIEINRIAQAADPLSNTFKVELRMKNPAESLKQGIIVETEISYLKYDKAIVIPLAAVQMSTVGPRVLVVKRGDDGYVSEVRDIVAVSISKDKVFISKGLDIGDVLIVSGAKGVMHGESVRVIMKDGKLLKRVGDNN